MPNFEKGSKVMNNHQLRVALAGNPNAGKTTIFNNLTGSRQHVGNYSGVTVEKKEGYRTYGDYKLSIVDLPGTYSLTAYSPEEVVARNFVVHESPDIIADVLDASNLERNLYLMTQFLELEKPVVLVLNMTDIAESRGITINDRLLAQKLGMPVVRTVGKRGRGMEELLDTLLAASKLPKHTGFAIDYGSRIEAGIRQLQELLTASKSEMKFPPRWLAIKLLENDQEVIDNIRNLDAGEKIIEHAVVLRKSLETELGDDPEMLIANLRYQFIGELYRQVAINSNTDNVTLSDKVDKVLTNRILGLPIFFGLMWLVFTLVFKVGGIGQEWLASGVTHLGNFAGHWISDSDLRSLVVDGIINGVGAVFSFLPLILLLFFAIALLEGSGYMARAAFIMDRVMNKVGLHGKSFIPLLLGFGCSVPAIMGTRTLENPRDRLVTILVAPLMSCSARLPIYTLLVAAFFKEQVAGTVLFSIYFLGIVMSVVMARIFRTFLFKGSTEPFIMELPPYGIPTAQSVMIHMWERSVLYAKKAGTIILAASIIMWFLTHYPTNAVYSRNFDELARQAQAQFSSQVAADIAPLKISKVEDNKKLLNLIHEITTIHTTGTVYAQKQAELKKLQTADEKLFFVANRYVELRNHLSAAQDKLDKEKAAEDLGHTYAGKIGRFFEPVMAPLGFDWKMNVALVAGFSAKETVISTLGTLYSLGAATDENSPPLKDALAADHAFNPLIAYVFMVFTLLYSPCLAAIATVKRETNSWKWALFTAAYTTGVAWAVAFAVYQGGMLLGLGG
jgi:ferrous iron transport protein B